MAGYRQREAGGGGQQGGMGAGTGRAIPSRIHQLPQLVAERACHRTNVCCRVANTDAPARCRRSGRRTCRLRDTGWRHRMETLVEYGKSHSGRGRAGTSCSRPSASQNTKTGVVSMHPGDPVDRGSSLHAFDRPRMPRAHHCSSKPAATKISTILPRDKQDREVRRMPRRYSRHL